MTLWNYLKAKMSQYERRVAFAGSGLTYGDLIGLEKERAEQRRLKICEGKTREEQAIEIIKCIASGNVAVPVSAEYGARNYEYIRQTVGGAPKEDVSDLAFLMFTSGTTGTPKGVMLTDENIRMNIEFISSYFNLSKCEKICIARPLVHIAVLTGELLYALCNGLTVQFYEEPFMPQRLLSYFSENKTDVFCATPTLYRALAKANKAKTSPIKVGALSGEILTEKVGREISAAFPETEFYNVYGLTEHSPRVSALLPCEFALYPQSVGRPIGSAKIRISGGELLVRSPCVMKGYYGEKDKTREKLAGGWLHTGDMARADKNGRLYIDGRKDNMIIRAGLNVYPEEIELAVYECAGVSDCAASGEFTENGVDICLKYVGTADPKNLRRELIKKLNPNIMPVKIERVAEIPRTPSGKKIRL